MKIGGKRYFLVEYCDMCPHSEIDDINEPNLSYLCLTTNKEIPKETYEEGEFPDWCPLPKEDE